MAKRPRTGIPERIIEAREAMGLTSAQLARRLGVQTRTLARWERGRTEPRSNRLVLLAGVLNVSPAWLLSGQGEAPAPQGMDVELRRLRQEIDELRANLEQNVEILRAMSDRLAELEGSAADL